MRVIVTGGSGFIGSRLVAGLLDAEHDVAVVDVCPSTARRVKVHTTNVLDTEELRRVVGGADVVIHLAGYVRDTLRRDPYAGATLQLQGTLNVLEACRLNGVAQVALASSFYVYSGLPDTEAVDENTSPDPLRLDIFGACKLMSESLCREYTRKYGLRHTILRLGSAYGAGGSNIISAFLDAGMRGETLQVWGSGRRRNQYTYVNDLACGIIASLDYPNETFNLVSPEVTTNAELGEMLGAKWGYRVELDASRPEEPSFPFVSPAKAISMLGWRPTGLENGLEATLAELRAGSGASPDLSGEIRAQGRQ